MNWRGDVFRSAITLAAMAALGGCAAHQKIVARPAALQSLAELPSLKLPDPATQPSDPAPAEALQLYAQGRDALLQNKKKDAQADLMAALQLDPASAVAHHDLGFALLGLDNARAAAEFRQAAAYDPLDADSRLQLARLLVAAKQYDAAAVQLRLARLSPDADGDDSLAAMIDLLLGRLLQSTHPAAALECYEHVIALLDGGHIQLRGQPELADLVRQPEILIIQAGDLALACGRYDKAAALYERVKRDNPQAADLLEWRIAGAELAAGHSDQATGRAMAIVENQHASFSSVLAFKMLFDRSGDPNAALKHLDARTPRAEEDTSSRHVLRSVLLMKDADAAVKEIDQATRFDLPAVRQLVHAYRAANRTSELMARLIALTSAQPQQWPALTRGWAILSQIGQPSPVSAETVERLPPGDYSAAKCFVESQLHLLQGEPVVARDRVTAAQEADPQLVHALMATASAAVVPDGAFADTTGLAELMQDDSDDPDLLNTLIGQLLQQGQKSIVQEALHVANGKQPANVNLAAAYAQVLAADEQRTEAIAVLDRAGAAKSAGELYVLSAQYSALGESSAAEQTLRSALKIDPNNAAVCNDLGYLLIDQGRDLDFAAPLVEKAVNSHRHNAAYLDSLGWLKYKQSKFEAAIGFLHLAILASDFPDPGVLDHAGDAYYRNQQPDKAAAAWNQAIAGIRARGTSDPQLRLRLENKLRQAAAKQALDLAPLEIKN